MEKVESKSTMIIALLLFWAAVFIGGVILYQVDLAPDQNQSIPVNTSPHA